MKTNGSAFVFKDSEKTVFNDSNEYITKYPKYAQNEMKKALQDDGRYGDGYLETWVWFGDLTDNNASGPFTVRGAYWYRTSSAGVFAFDDFYGYGGYGARFPLGVSCAVTL